MDEEKMAIIKEKEQAQQKYMEAQMRINELSERNSKAQSELTCLKEKFSSSVSEEKKRIQEERKVVKESLKMEMNLMQARYEASYTETRRTSETNDKIRKKLRDNHTQQIQEVNNKHKEEMRQQLETFHEEIKKKDIKLKTAATEYEERLTDAQDKIAALSNQRQQLENERHNLTIRMHQMMQTHFDEALRLLTANKSPAKADIKVESMLKTNIQGGTSKWQHQAVSLLSLH
ncbi:centrobin-like [Actinia tenebrosa]|uniref:Centrobin-like n=1 Tax=Actinia tenebrosa TaxID=6105 RepID=A0A6P8HAN9_ACTTE|nr:centrobin-like [Actinia tenebrosa]